jgi:transcriptional regulator with GAF, ATPase, and Fis domain
MDTANDRPRARSVRWMRARDTSRAEVEIVTLDDQLRIPACCRCAGVDGDALPEALRSRLVEPPVGKGPPGICPPWLLWLGGAHDGAVEALRELSPNGLTRVLVVVAGGQLLSNDVVWRLVRAGASDVIPWDGTPETTGAIADRFGRWAAVDTLLATPTIRERLVGCSAVWLATLRQLVEMSAFTDASILLLGESGVGKEEAARLVHALDRRRDKRELVVVDCATVVAELSGSEFFGHERGAFTGAASARDGAFALAEGGTLLLDEVGELPLALQAQLLRVIQERTFKRVGANVWQRIDFRLVCATNRDLVEEVAHGRFRSDLYHRIAASSCRLPSLRERAADILPLSQHFLRMLLPEVEPAFDATVQEFLLQRAYPGNVRELRQLVTRMGKRHVGNGRITVGDIPPDELARADGLGCWPDAAFEAAVARALTLGIGLKEIARAATETAIRLALRNESGSLQRAARRLGVTDRALQIRRAQRGVEHE